MAQVSRTPKCQRKTSLQKLSMSLRKLRTLLNRAPTAGALRDIAPLASKKKRPTGTSGGPRGRENYRKLTSPGRLSCLS